MTLIHGSEAEERKFADVTVKNLVTAGLSPAVSLSIATVSGDHPVTASSRSDRIYYVLSGTATVQVGDASHDVVAGDAIYIRKTLEHAIKGEMEYVLVNSPAFDASLE